FNEQNASYSRYTIDSVNLKANRFFAIEKIDGKWWCGTGRGLQIFDPVTKKINAFVDYPGKKPMLHSAIWVHRDRHKFTWYAGWGDAIYRYDPATRESTRFDS